MMCRSLAFPQMTQVPAEIIRRKISMDYWRVVGVKVIEAKDYVVENRGFHLHADIRLLYIVGQALIH